jgi:hypothetical protein
LNKKELEKLATVLDGAESIIVITETKGEVALTYSQDMNDMEVLDLLAMVTSGFYEIAEEGDSPIH